MCGERIKKTKKKANFSFGNELASQLPRSWPSTGPRQFRQDDAGAQWRFPTSPTSRLRTPIPLDRYPGSAWVSAAAPKEGRCSTRPSGSPNSFSYLQQVVDRIAGPGPLRADRLAPVRSALAHFPESGRACGTPAASSIPAVRGHGADVKALPALSRVLFGGSTRRFTPGCRARSLVWPVRTDLR